MAEESGSERRREDGSPKRPDEPEKKRRRDPEKKSSRAPENKRDRQPKPEGRRRPKPRRRREPEPVVRRKPGEPGPARLYALLAGAGLSMLGILGFFYDAGFGTGAELDGDDIAGILIVNGWRNLIYLLSGLLALAFAASRPRAVTLMLAAIYLAIGIAGAANTNADIGSLLDALPLTREDNAFHIVIGGLALLAFLADGGLRRPRPARRDQALS